MSDPLHRAAGEGHAFLPNGRVYEFMNLKTIEGLISAWHKALDSVTVLLHAQVAGSWGWFVCDTRCVRTPTGFTIHVRQSSVTIPPTHEAHGLRLSTMPPGWTSISSMDDDAKPVNFVTPLEACDGQEPTPSSEPGARAEHGHSLQLTKMLKELNVAFQEDCFRGRLFAPPARA
jgi:hypothetical protein